MKKILNVILSEILEAIIKLANAMVTSLIFIFIFAFFLMMFLFGPALVVDHYDDNAWSFLIFIPAWIIGVILMKQCGNLINRYYLNR